MERTNGAPDEVNGHTNEATNGTNGYSNHHMNGACQQENGSAHEHNGQTNGTPNGANTEFSPKVLNTCSAADRSTLSLFDLTGKPYNIQVNALFPGYALPIDMWFSILIHLWQVDPHRHVRKICPQQGLQRQYRQYRARSPMGQA